MSDPAVLIVEDDINLREALGETLGESEFPVITAASGSEALEILDNRPVGLVVTDVQMDPMTGHELLGRIRERHPALPTVLMTAYGTIENAVDVMKEGAADYLVKPFEANVLIDVVRRHLRLALVDDNPIAADARSIELLRIARRVAATNATVTISGDSGTGKEVVARYIHAHSSRSKQDFVAINCAAIPENMLEAVLFGHEKGAFTGATSAHAGKFEQANGGTLLLDEISEMDLGLQAKILRVIQEREVERIGGRKTIDLDVRVLATTNRDLRQYVVDGNFREDLFYRLNVFPLCIPPLRERPGDILPLAEATIRKLHDGERCAPTISECAASVLLAHTWPGNVRELENVLQRTLILSQGSVITADDLAFEAPGSERQPCAGALLQDDLRHQEFRLIIDALREGGGNRTETAAKLGISPRTLRYKLAKMRTAGMVLPDDKHNLTH